MSDNPRGTNPLDPTDEAAAEQSTQTASGLTSGRREPGGTADDDCPDREDTPRRYDEAADPALPSDDASLKTKI